MSVAHAQEAVEMAAAAEEEEKRVVEVISKGNAEHYVWGGDCDGWHMLKASGLSVIEERVPPGRSEVRHYHVQSHQFFFVLAGRGTVDVEGRQLKLQSRQRCSIPPHVRTSLTERTEPDARWVRVWAPW